MTRDKYDHERTTPKTLDDLYAVVSAIDERVEDIRSDLRDFLDSQSDYERNPFFTEDYMDEYDRYAA